MLSSTKDLFSFRSYIYHMTKMDRIHIFGLNLSAVHRDLDNPNTLFKYSCISLFWKEIYISLQLNLFLRTMFVVVDFSLVTTTLKIEERRNLLYSQDAILYSQDATLYSQDAIFWMSITLIIFILIDPSNDYRQILGVNEF